MSGDSKPLFISGIAPSHVRGGARGLHGRERAGLGFEIEAARRIVF